MAFITSSPLHIFYATPSMKINIYFKVQPNTSIFINIDNNRRLNFYFLMLTIFSNSSILLESIEFSKKTTFILEINPTLT